MAQIKADEISKVLLAQIKNFDSLTNVSETGSVISVGDGIARLYGLQKVMAGELIDFGSEAVGIALNLEQDQVGAVLLGNFAGIREGDQVRRTGRIMSIPVGEAMIGRVVNSLGEPIDDKGPLETKEFAPLERLAPGVVDRQPVKEPLQTGIKAIDAMVPIGRGQRELIIGDRQTGKTTIALDTIINQKQQRNLHLRSNRPKALHGGASGESSRAARGYGIHGCCSSNCFRSGSNAIHCAVRRLRDWRVLPRFEASRSVYLRRSFKARRSVSRDFVAAAPSSRP